MLPDVSPTHYHSAAELSPGWGWISAIYFWHAVAFRLFGSVGGGVVVRRCGDSYQIIIDEAPEQ